MFDLHELGYDERSSKIKPNANQLSELNSQTFVICSSRPNELSLLDTF